MVGDRYPIGSMYAIYGNIYHQYTPNVSIYTIHGSYGYVIASKIASKTSAPSVNCTRSASRSSASPLATPSLGALGLVDLVATWRRLRR